jgi:hypothetical protein
VTRRRRLLTLLLAVWGGGWLLAGAPAQLPDRLADQEFWRLTADLFEPNGYFRSDNLVSDERIFQDVVPALRQRPRGGVYLGVGPEQNFTYIAALEPRLAFVIDLRRGNLHLQLLYKALFELSADRAEFVSRLFAKARPAGLTRASTVDEVMAAFWNVPSSDAGTFRQNVAAVDDLLVRKHGFPLSKDDLAGIEYVYNKFYWFGPSITWGSSSGMVGGVLPTFADLVRQAGSAGERLSFLATEERFAVVKSLETANLVVPVVGNFAGPKALRAVGQYIRERGATVSAFYVSEVEAYLVQDQLWSAFCANAATLPVDDASVFIRPALTGFGSPAGRPGVAPTLAAAFTSPRATLPSIAAETRACRAPGPVPAGPRGR